MAGSDGVMAMDTEQGWMLLLFVTVTFALAGVGALWGERGASTSVWYASLRKPARYPAEWIFAQGWSLVAICTGVAGWLIWRQWLAGSAATALVLFGFQLGLNVVWQGAVFGLRRLGLGLAESLLLWATITVTALYAARAPGWAWCWLVPYWLWVGYGVWLNYQLWRLNPAVSLSDA